MMGLILFEFENTFRNGISYGIFATIVLSKKLSEYQVQNTYDRIFPLILPAFLFFILLELTFFVINISTIKQKNTKLIFRSNETFEYQKKYSDIRIFFVINLEFIFR
ncbi:hypothetical protein ONA24_02860 [Mycoplasmopsis cynos]|uniref:hypothetical protein n=1 Tax=Mycoplasmopsis cynos TaxID=171284 RepID=UPI0024CD546D|nr:hypothetical protein [Mycoplasmopsis cynos]WAM10194.1 hypothetical protein ONA24_02860 [Mycoplasmopsis cynos]